MSNRLAKVNALLHERIAEHLVRKFELPGVFVTVTRVETTPDLKIAKAFISVLPDGKRQVALKALRRFAPSLNKILFRELNCQPVPKVFFHLDEQETYAQDIDSLLDTLT